MINCNNCIHSDRTRFLSMSCIFIILCCRFPHTHLRVNPCGSHVNPRSVEWIISMILSLFRFWRMVAVTGTSSTLFIRFLYYNVQSLLGVIFYLVGIIFFLTDCSNFFALVYSGVWGTFPQQASCIVCTVLVYTIHRACWV